jgi:hypothetical protein
MMILITMIFLLTTLTGTQSQHEAEAFTDISRVGFNMAPPVLDIYRDEMTISAGEPLTITCSGESQLNWTLPYSKVSAWSTTVYQ